MFLSLPCSHKLYLTGLGLYPVFLHKTIRKWGCNCLIVCYVPQMERTWNWEIGHGIWLIAAPFNAWGKAPLTFNRRFYSSWGHQIGGHQVQVSTLFHPWAYALSRIRGDDNLYDWTFQAWNFFVITLWAGWFFFPFFGPLISFHLKYSLIFPEISIVSMGLISSLC